MKKILSLLAFATSLAASAQVWQLPEYTGEYQPLTPDDTVYIYNTEAKLFLTEANDWGTHASVGLEGLRFIVSKHVVDDKWDGTSYTIRNYSLAKAGWYNMFITEGGHIYMDYNSSGDIYFKFTEAGQNTYNIAGSPANTTWTDMEDYLIGRYTKYVDNKDGIETGTGVIYEYNNISVFDAGEFQYTWAFVSQADYAAHMPKVVTYNTALQLGALIEKAEGIGVDVTSPKAVYNDTSSSTEQLQQAIDEANAAILQYYEQTITPANPLDMTDLVENSTCDVAGEGWINEINCSSLGTGDWVPDNSDEGATDGTYLSGWDPSLHGKAYQLLTGLPNGIYKVSLGALSQSLPQALYANDNRKDIPAENLFHNYSVITNVTDGQLEFGIVQDVTGENWFCFDNVTLQYLGCGTEAYRQWLTMLLESAPKFDEEVAQDSLLNVYNGILASVETAQTKEEIMAIIPAYESVLNEITLNTKAYSDLKTALAEEDEWIGVANAYYGDIVVDYVLSTAQPAYEEHTLSTESINEIVAKMSEYKDMVQDFGWRVDDYNSAVDELKSLYEQYKDACALETADAASQLLDKIAAFDMSMVTTDDIKAMLTEIYDMDFLLQIPSEPATDENPLDYTSKIQYPSFYDGNKGWTNEEWSTCGYNSWHGSDFAECLDERYLNLWNSTGGCRVYQTLTNLPNGTYTFTIGVYSDADGVQVFANDASVEVFSGKTHDQLMGQYYSVDVDVTDGTLTIGVRYDGEGSAWVMIDNCTLTYYGTESERSAIDDIVKEKGAATYYSLSGVRLPALAKGINIVRQSDGKVVKKYVK